MTKPQLTIHDVADFTWDFSKEFFLETDKGNFVWSDPEYGGNNTISHYSGTISDWLGALPYGRSKGIHEIGKYCGPNVQILSSNQGTE